MLERATQVTKFILILLTNMAIWVYLYAYLSAQPLVLKSGNLALPQSFFSDSMHYGMLFNAIVFYINYFVLIDKYMSQNISRYLMVSGCLVLLITLIESSWDMYILSTVKNDMFALSTMIFLLNLAIHSIFWLVSATVKTSINWVKQERLKNALDAQRIDAELSLLKSQIHPHFLFNTLNTLYSSAYHSGDTQTANGIGKLSHLLRYMLYETSSSKVDLDKEIEYLENYIALQQMRFAQDVEVSFIIEGEVENFQLAPMLLITLVENAFKHGISPATNTQISIFLDIKSTSHLVFSVENTKLKPRNNHLINNNIGGMGLKNLEKRLAMLYPKNHIFKTEIINDKFIARLELT